MNKEFNPNVIKRRFKTFSVKAYRRMLKAWICPSDSVDNSSDDIDNSLKSSNGSPLRSKESYKLDDSCAQKPLQPVQPFDDYTPQKSGYIESNETLRETDKTIELNDSLDSIPETPDFVEKRKELQKEKNKRVNKRLVSEFFDFESEVAMDSKESLCDDIEDTQREFENSSQTIIDDIIPMDTQPIGQLINGIDSRSAEDMHSVYLRSVRSQMIGKTEKFKLQYNYDPNIDVFSQEPNESDLEDYEFDSFCVPNDSIEFIESPKIGTNSMETSIDSPSAPIRRKDRKKFKRIIFSP